MKKLPCCPKCGTELRPNAKFCHKCGTPGGRKITGQMRKRCSESDYMRLSYEEQRRLVNGFLALIESKYPDSDFGYDSFHDLDYDQMVLSIKISSAMLNLY